MRFLVLSGSAVIASFLTGCLAAPNATYLSVTAPRANIFKELTRAEKTSVSNFVRTNLQNADIQLVNILLPNKTDALRYLDGSGTQPGRYARVLTQTTCYMKEYMVGPLPVGTTTKLSPLDYTFGGNGTYSFPGCKKNTMNVYLRNPTEDNGLSGTPSPNDVKAAPMTILPEGPRYQYDPAENYVSWMDFTFYLGVGRAGLGLYDVRFKGQRVIYELGIQEALAHYAGANQYASSTAYLDFLLGFTPMELVPGYDCPDHATFSDNRSFCLFEYPKDYPMQRHDAAFISVTKNIVFIARSSTTVDNYDYLTTYEFYMDGSIRIILRASGYIAWTQWTNAPADPEYGFHIRDGNSGSMHDHVINFKLDIDINGTANSLFKTKFVPLSTTYPWSNGRTINTMKLERSFISNEDGGKINWDENSASTYSVVNKANPNKFGEYPGFKIYPSTGSTIYNTVRNSTNLQNAINWATNHMFVLKRKDSEPRSAHEFNYWSPTKPFVDFNSFFNSESLDQEDLVLYFNLGMHHLPDTSDLPNTVFTGAESGITLRPQNYLLSDASRSTRQQVRVSGPRAAVNYYGAHQPSGSFNLDATNPDLSKVNPSLLGFGFGAPLAE